MASAELKQIREILTKESIREHQLSRVGGTETDMFTCSKCRGKSCTYTQVETCTSTPSGCADELDHTFHIYICICLIGADSKR